MENAQQGIGNLGRVFNAYPTNLDELKTCVKKYQVNRVNEPDKFIYPCEAASFQSLLKLFHDLIMFYNDYSIGFDKTKLDTIGSELVEILVDTMHTIACREFLTEDGKIYPEIIAILDANNLLSNLLNTHKQAPIQIIYSYFSQILSQTLWNEWRRGDGEYLGQFIVAKVKAEHLVPIFETKLRQDRTSLELALHDILKEIKLEKARNAEIKRIKDILNDFIRDKSAPLFAKQDQLLPKLEDISELAKQEKDIDKLPQVFINALLPQANNPFQDEDIRTVLKEKLTKGVLQELYILDPLRSIFSQKDPVDVLMEEFLSNWGTIIDAVKHETNITQLAETFINALVDFLNNSKASQDFKNHSETLREKLLPILKKTENEVYKVKLEEVQNFVMMIFQNSDPKQLSLHKKFNDYTIYGRPLAHLFLKILYIDIHQYVAVADWKPIPTENQLSNLNLQTFKLDAYNQNFLLEYFNQLMQPQATDKQLQNFVVKIIFYTIGKTYTVDGEFNHNIIKMYGNEFPSAFASLLINNVIIEWLSNPENQLKFIKDLNKDTINKVVDKITKLMKKGLSVDFLNTIKGFPFTKLPRVDSKQFTRPIFKYQITTDIKILKDKLYDIKQMLEEIDLYSKNIHKDVFSECENCVTNLNVIRENYQAQQIILAPMLSNAEALFADHLKKIEAARAQIQEQHDKLIEFASNLKNNIYTHEFIKSVFTDRLETFKTNIANGVLAAKASIQTLLDKLTNINTNRANAAQWHAQIISQLRTIAKAPGWKQKVAIRGGKQNGNSKAPTKVALVATLTNSGLKFDDDMFLATILNRFNEAKVDKTGFFKNWGYHEDTKDFYTILDNLHALLQEGNFYNVAKLQEISQALEAFKPKLNLKPAVAQPAVFMNGHAH